MSCAFEPCDQVEACCLPGGCVVKNAAFQQPPTRTLITAPDEGLKENAPALNGTKPAHDGAHPSTKKKNRKALTLR